jgi:hypothetical protein
LLGLFLDERAWARAAGVGFIDDRTLRIRPFGYKTDAVPRQLTAMRRSALFCPSSPIGHPGTSALLRFLSPVPDESA